MRVTSSRAYARPPPVPRMPAGLVKLMQGLSREVLKNNPPDVYAFCANHMEKLLELRDGPPPVKPLTLEEKIAKAQEIVKQRAKERREKFDKEYKLQFNKDFEEACKEEIQKKTDTNEILKQDVPNLKSPVHHEDDLEHESEIEISHTKLGRENVSNSPLMFAKLSSPDNVHESLLKNDIEAGDEHENRTGDIKSATHPVEDKIECHTAGDASENHTTVDKPENLTGDKPNSSVDDKPEDITGAKPNTLVDDKPKNHSVDVKPESLITDGKLENQSEDDKPENPATSNKLENELTDDQPNNLETDKPLNYSVDDKPEQNATGDIPENPKAGDKPEHHSVDDRPQNLATDDKSEQNATGDIPENPEAEDQPKNHSVDDKPENLTTDDKPENHPADDKLGNDAVDDIPENHSADAKPGNDAKNDKPENRSTDDKPENLTIEDKPENQSADGKLENHATGDKARSHSADDKPENHTTDDKPENHSADKKPENLATGDVPGNLATDDYPENNSVDVKSDNRADEESHAEKSYVQKYHNKPENPTTDDKIKNLPGDKIENIAAENKDENLGVVVKFSEGDVSHAADDKPEYPLAHRESRAVDDKLENDIIVDDNSKNGNPENQPAVSKDENNIDVKSENYPVVDKSEIQATVNLDKPGNHATDNELESLLLNAAPVNHPVDDKPENHLTNNKTENHMDVKPINDINTKILENTDNNSVKELETRGNDLKDKTILEKVLGEVPNVTMNHHHPTIEDNVHVSSESHLQTIAESPIENMYDINEIVPELTEIPVVSITVTESESVKNSPTDKTVNENSDTVGLDSQKHTQSEIFSAVNTVSNILSRVNDKKNSDFEKPLEALNEINLNKTEPIDRSRMSITEKPSELIKIEITVPDDTSEITQSDANNSVLTDNNSVQEKILENHEKTSNDKEQAQNGTDAGDKNLSTKDNVPVTENKLLLPESVPNSELKADTNVVANLQMNGTNVDDDNITNDLKSNATEQPNNIEAKTLTDEELNDCDEKHDATDNALLSMTDSTGNNTAEDNSIAETESSKTDDDSAVNNANMDLETAAITIQKVFRSFMFKSRNSTFDDTVPDDNNSIDVDEESSEKKDEYYAAASINKERRPLGITRMDTVLQTVNEEKSLSLSTDDSSTLSSAATTIQAHVRGFLVRNRMNSNKTMSMSSLVNSHEVLESDPEQQKNKTVLNIHIVPEEGNYFSRDESLITSMDLSLDGSPPSSVNLHPLSYDISERRKMLKREDAVQSVSPPSNNSGKLSEESVKEILINDSDVLDIDLADDKIKSEEDQTNDLDNDASDLISDSSATPITEIHVFKNEDPIVSPMPEEVLQYNEANFIKMNSDEADVITPYVPSPRPKSENGCKLVHSGEFHDVALPTKVSRNDTSVVRGE